MKDKFTISVSGHKPLIFTEKIPTGLETYLIPGSQVFANVASFGTVMLQLIELDGYSWLYSIFDITEDVSIDSHYTPGLSLCHINIAGGSEHLIEGIGRLTLKESRFFILFCPVLSATTEFKKSHFYRYLDIGYPTEFLLRSLVRFPLLDTFEKSIRLTIATAVLKEEMHTNAAIAAKIYQLIHSPFSRNVRNFHLNIARSLLPMLLKQACKIVPQDNKFTTDEAQMIDAAKEFIDANLANHFFINEIAREVGMNEKKLKKGFKGTFGKGLFEYLLTERLNIARIAVEETLKPIKQIAYQAGYKSVSNFSTAFKRIFGYTPLHLRNKYRKPEP